MHCGRRTSTSDPLPSLATQGAQLDWSREEVEAIVAHYLEMLTLELAGQGYSKSEHRRVLATKLKSRSEGSIEFKRCNVSAVLIELGFPYIRGYRPRANFQALLAEVVADQVRRDPLLDQAALLAVQLPALAAERLNFDGIKEEAPIRHERATVPMPPVFHAQKRDYLEREAHNRSLGAAGEEAIVQFERWRLASTGRERLADRIEHISKTRGRWPRVCHPFVQLRRERALHRGKDYIFRT